MMDLIDIRNKLIDLIVTNFAIRSEMINDEVNIEDLGISKLSDDSVYLLRSVEGEFDITVDNDEFLNINTFLDLLKLVEKCVAEKEKNSNSETNQ